MVLHPRKCTQFSGDLDAEYANRCPFVLSHKTALLGFCEFDKLEKFILSNVLIENTEATIGIETEMFFIDVS
jgi:hypothetical protein